jgi:hypothetical protein
LNAPFVKVAASTLTKGLLVQLVTEKAVLHLEELKRNALIVAAPVIK